MSAETGGPEIDRGAGGVLEGELAEASWRVFSTWRSTSTDVDSTVPAAQTEKSPVRRQGYR